jgi:SNF2 family DNA or RNA helicase
MNYSGDWSKGGPDYDSFAQLRPFEEELNGFTSTAYFNPESIRRFLINLHSPSQNIIPDPKTYEPPNYRMKLNENSTEAELLEAIRITKEAGDECEAASEAHLEISSEARIQVTNLDNALRFMRDVRERHDGSSREFRLAKQSLQRQLSWLQDLYTTIITRAKEMASLHDELEFFEKLARERPWGSRAFDYQLDGAKQMAIEKRVVLADEMGLGKTLSAIMACDLSRAAKVLVITQNDIVSNFSREVGKWAEDRIMIPLGTIKDKFARHLALKSLDSQVGFVVLVNYEMWRRDKEILKLLIGLKFDTVIVDEAHNMKDDKGQNFKGVRDIVYAENLDYSCKSCGATFKDWPWSDLCPECYKPLGRRNFNSRCSVVRVYPMTGTPILNDPADAFPMLHLIDRVAFPDKKTYLLRYCVQREVQSLVDTTVKKWFFTYGGESMLTSKLGVKYIRRTLEDSGIKLPPQDEQIHTLAFEHGEYIQQRKVIAGIKKFNMILLNEMGDAANVPYLLTLINRERQAVSYPAGIKLWEKRELGDGKTKMVMIGKCDIKESIKVDYSLKLIKDLLEAGQKVVLFSKFTEPLERLEELLKAEGIDRVACYDGSASRERLDKIAIQADAGFTKKSDMLYDVLLVSYAKGGTGVNFTNYRQTILLDREWNPSKENQAEARTHRIGQNESTTVHRITVEGTIDEGIDELIERKAQLADGLNEETQRFSLIKYLERKFEES